MSICNVVNKQFLFTVLYMQLVNYTNVNHLIKSSEDLRSFCFNLLHFMNINFQLVFVFFS